MTLLRHSPPSSPPLHSSTPSSRSAGRRSHCLHHIDSPRSPHPSTQGRSSFSRIDSITDPILRQFGRISLGFSSTSCASFFPPETLARRSTLHADLLMHRQTGCATCPTRCPRGLVSLTTTTCKPVLPRPPVTSFSLQASRRTSGCPHHIMFVLYRFPVEFKAISTRYSLLAPSRQPFSHPAVDVTPRSHSSVPGDSAKPCSEEQHEFLVCLPSPLLPTQGHRLLCPWRLASDPDSLTLLGRGTAVDTTAFP